MWIYVLLISLVNVILGFLHCMKYVQRFLAAKETVRERRGNGNVLKNTVKVDLGKFNKSYYIHIGMWFTDKEVFCEF